MTPLDAFYLHRAINELRRIRDACLGFARHERSERMRRQWWCQAKLKQQRLNQLRGMLPRHNSQAPRQVAGGQQ